MMKRILAVLLLVSSLGLSQTASVGNPTPERMPFASLPPLADGSIIYCVDCAPTNPCVGSGTGALAIRINSSWNCASGSVSGATLTYYLQSTNSALTNGSAIVVTDKQALTLPEAAKTPVDIAHNASADVVLQSWATDPGFPGVSFVPAGVYILHMHALRLSGNRSVTLYAVFREVTATGVPVGTIGTQTESTTALTGAELEYTVSMAVGSPYIPALSTSRIVLDYHAVFTGGSSNTTVRTYVGGTADSHLSMPSNSVDATSFVPYLGATQPLDMGTHTVSAAPGKNIPSWARYSLVKIANGVNGCANANGCWQVNGVLGANAAASLTQDVVLFQLPSNGAISQWRIKPNTACTGSTTAVTGLGTAADNIFYRLLTLDIQAAPGATNFDGGVSASGSTTTAAVNVVASLVNTVNDIDQLVAGCAVDYWLRWAVLP